MKTKSNKISIWLVIATISLVPIWCRAQVNPAVQQLADGVLNAHSIVLAVYPGYAPDLKVAGAHKPLGFGVAALYPLSEHSFTGLRVDYLGDSFFAPSVDVGYKYDLTVAGYSVTVFGVTGVIAPLQGAGSQNLEAGAILGFGFTANLWTSKDKNEAFNVFFEAEKWTQFDGIIYRPGAAFTIKF